MKPAVDVAILGGGCAGLSLAVALARFAPHLRVQVLESRREYKRDRTWCFWNTEHHPFESCVARTWSRWCVRRDDKVAVQQSRRYRYQCIPGDRFYDFAQERISAAQNQELRLGVSVASLWHAGDGVHIETSEGSLLAGRVFDSRPSLSHSTKGMLQRFTGWYVRTNSPCFDAETVELMDFQPADVPGRTTFFYTLPFSATEAMVEATYLDLPALPPAYAEIDLAQRLDRMTAGRGYQVLFKEHGTLPMRFEPVISGGASDDRVTRIGTLGGRVKPSSGYAFLRIQRQSRAIARALARNAPVPRHYEPGIYAALDRVFLRALQAHPAAAPHYFFRLFQLAPPDALIRFLSEDGGLLETFQIVRALPASPFLQAAASALLI